MMFCPLHRRPLLVANDCVCVDCERLGIKVETCELDKINRTIDTLQETGREVDFSRSYAVIVVNKNDAIS